MVRKDAARNRDRLISAARTVFAERGIDATLDDIAREAGVGTGTAYRHFPNKKVIAAEILADATQQIATDAEDALSIDDPWDAMVAFFENTSARLATDRGLYQILAGQGNVDDKTRIWPHIVDGITRLFDRAKEAGVIRADAEPEDAAVLFAMLGVTFSDPGLATLSCATTGRIARHRPTRVAMPTTGIRDPRRRHRRQQALGNCAANPVPPLAAQRKRRRHRSPTRRHGR